MGLMKPSEFEKQTLALEILRADNAIFPAYLDWRRLQPVDSAPLLRLSLFDIGKVEHAEAERHAPPDSRAKT